MNWRMLKAALLLALFAFAPARAQHSLAAVAEVDAISARFALEVRPQLAVPAAALAGYTQALEAALASAQVSMVAPQFLLLVDRSPNVQAALLLWGASGGAWQLVGAVPVSTGLPGTYEHFVTPTGVFDHSTAQPDYRAEGTRNKLGFRGYGSKGMRVYDLGWVAAPRGWGDGAMGTLRLQMHATDPVLAEPLLGTPRSEGCIRIAASFNTFVDLNGLLDADYDAALREGAQLWVLNPARTPVVSAGRFIVVVDSASTERAPWSPAPARASLR
ncbi:L,D-transpeptidase [Massilia sp. DWR3-1-1]|uniref:L,D-transpeptidase n=1 Tax=Massilia sp. DWR3-1-1 TaxID=2804559 RepID=UPI003CFA3B09